jgi:hypothetical protein
MNAADTILECESRGIRLSLAETLDALDFDAPAGAMTSELRVALVAYKADVIQVLFEREERAALMGAPEWCDASTWIRGVSHPATLALLEKLAPLGVEIISVRPLGVARDEEAA